MVMREKGESKKEVGDGTSDLQILSALLNHEIPSNCVRLSPRDDVCLVVAGRDIEASSEITCEYMQDKEELKRQWGIES